MTTALSLLTARSSVMMTTEYHHIIQTDHWLNSHFNNCHSSAFPMPMRQILAPNSCSDWRQKLEPEMTTENIIPAPENCRQFSVARICSMRHGHHNIVSECIPLVTEICCLVLRGVGTGPADMAAAGPIIWPICTL